MAAFATSALRGLTRSVPVLRLTLGGLPRRSHHLTPVDDELFQRTTISLLEKDSPNVMYIDSYSPRGFTINGNRVVGPCALVPHSVMQWNVGSHRDITEESFSLFWMLEPRIEIVVVGTGDRMEKLHPEILKAMRKRRIAVEVQDTPNACATFNFLCNEGRVAGAALIPPPGGSLVAPVASSHVE
ncbi:NADH dehydrogenase [ubiquinone] 1 alpha subcomplex assembly factor 3 isoform X1 [Monodelphis domestica]|uniref:NADH dehydrogenase [ubiquinone] 1 alpha subcomplex assembly factor 3 n=2 Tax=Monodelphis domestica TaxID=13616 RepID=F6ZJF8_MONDO|nr:NADH dehydrogenase [ubiquinone] 1 alpha subcomplex assembly factor 3 isoform X1 [Monodelphis domestica]